MRIIQDLKLISKAPVGESPYVSIALITNVRRHCLFFLKMQRKSATYTLGCIFLSSIIIKITLSRTCCSCTVVFNCFVCLYLFHPSPVAKPSHSKAVG